jgi:hypothetical protein
MPIFYKSYSGKCRPVPILRYGIKIMVQLGAADIGQYILSFRYKCTNNKLVKIHARQYLQNSYALCCHECTNKKSASIYTSQHLSPEVGPPNLCAEMFSTNAQIKVSGHSHIAAPVRCGLSGKFTCFIHKGRFKHVFP